MDICNLLCNLLLISKNHFWIVFIPNWPNAADGAHLRGLIGLLQFYPLDVLHVIMNHLQISEQNTRGKQWSCAANKYNWKFPSSFSLILSLPQCVADGGSCTPSSAPLLALLTCRLKPRRVFKDKTALMDNKPDQYHFGDITLKFKESASSRLA